MKASWRCGGSPLIHKLTTCVILFCYPSYLDEFISECDLFLEQLDFVLQRLILVSQLQHLLWATTEKRNSNVIQL